MKEVKSFKKPLLELLLFLGFSILYFIVSAHYDRIQNYYFKTPLLGLVLIYLFTFLWGIFFSAIHRGGLFKAKRPHPFYLILSMACILCFWGFIVFNQLLPGFMMAYFRKADYFLLLYGGANFAAAFYEPPLKKSQ